MAGSADVTSQQRKATAALRSGRSGLAVVGRHNLVFETARRLRTDCRVPTGATILAAVSGGADSTALLLACCALRRRRRAGRPLVRLAAAHVHHHLRPSADEDAAFVADLCARLDVELHVGHVHPGELAGNVSANARRLRYEALGEIARRIGASHVAVAHHAEDQLETMLMNLCRGRGLGGLVGMRWSRPLVEGVALVRPLLASRKAACEELCRSAGIEWREDPSNVDVSRARARLRRDVLPALEALWPDAARRAAETADALAIANGLFDQAVARSFGSETQTQWERADLKNLPRPMIASGLRRALRAAGEKTSGGAGQAQLLKAAAAIGDDEVHPRRFGWPGGVTLIISAHRVEVSGQENMT